MLTKQQVILAIKACFWYVFKASKAEREVFRQYYWYVFKASKAEREVFRQYYREERSKQ